MGKPFKSELNSLSDTFEWSLNAPIDILISFIWKSENKPLLAIGSGGSYSACHYAAMLHQEYGNVSKAITPLDLFYSQKIIKKSNLLFISASGKNNDILSSFQLAIQHEPKDILSICMQTNTKLAELSSQYSISTSLEYKMPSGKDGFLATNTLLSYFLILARGYKILNDTELILLGRKINDNIIRDIKINDLYKIKTFTVLYGGWALPVAIDLESKFTESAIGNVHYSDYRNFGHGRHHWYAKNADDSIIIALITPEEKKIAERTLNLIPNSVQKFTIESNFNGPTATIDLLVQAFYLVDFVGKARKIDPGKPGVPEFGSKLYHLKYSSFYSYNLLKGVTLSMDSAIVRKANKNTFSELNGDEISYWKNAYYKFVEKFESLQFGAVVFDYDGTLCSIEDRFNGISQDVKKELIRLLEMKIVLGVVTGRGKSVKEALREAVPEAFWEQIIVGYYNGSDVGFLSDDRLPIIDRNTDKELQDIYNYISADILISKELAVNLRPSQLTIEPKIKNRWPQNRIRILELVAKNQITNVQILESSHSIDIISYLQSKTQILKYCTKELQKKKLSQKILCIGDKGQWPGNDYQLLSTCYSLSVDEVSSNPDSCWNLASPGLKGIMATLKYLECIQSSNEGFVFDSKLLLNA